MIIFNGTIQPSDLQLTTTNRSFLYGDGVFETLKIVNNKILFFEEHYFRLMASMRIVRMEIPDNFTLEYLEEQVLNLVTTLKIEASARVRVTVFRNQGGFYAPLDNSVSFVIQAQSLENSHYLISKTNYEVDLYKDFLITKQLLSTLKTTSKMIHVTASIFAKENGLQNCLLLNDDKNVAEAIQGNLFMLMGDTLITPPISEGCLNGIMRKQIIKIAKESGVVQVKEEVISPFDLQKADELFVTNVIQGIQPITQYRKKSYTTDYAESLLIKLNALI